MRMKGSVKTTQVESPRQEDDVRGIVVEMMVEQHAKGISGLDRDILEWNVPEGGAFRMSVERERRA